MNPRLRPLLDLQTLDLRIAEIKDLQRKLPALIETAQAPLQQATQQVNELTVSVEAATKERRSLERDLEAHEAQTEKLRARLSELKTNKEYQAHLFEIEMANKKKGEIEEKILIYMEKIEQQQKESAEAQQRKAAAEQRFAQEKTAFEAQHAALTAELGELEQKQKNLAASLDKGLLAKYNKIKAARKEQPLAPIRNGNCSGCRLQLPPQLVAAVKRSDEVLTCTFCHRILYWEGEPVAEPAATTRERPDDEAGESV